MAPNNIRVDPFGPHTQLHCRLHVAVADRVDERVDAPAGRLPDSLGHPSLYSTGTTPRCFNQAWLRLLASPITVAPRRWANCPASDPPPPAAPETTTVSAGWGSAANTVAYAVVPQTSTTTPTRSLPCLEGHVADQLSCSAPLRICASPGRIPAARTSTSTYPGSGVGRATSSTRSASIPPYAWNRTASLRDHHTSSLGQGLYGHAADGRRRTCGLTCTVEHAHPGSRRRVTAPVGRTWGDSQWPPTCDALWRRAPPRRCLYP